MEQTGTKRKLAAILMADVVEYVRHMGEDAAREQLDQAGELFRDMGKDWWTEQAEGLRERIDRGKPFNWFAPYVDGPQST